MAETRAKLETKRILIMVLGFCSGFAVWILFILTSEDTLHSDLKVLRKALKVSLIYQIS